MTYHITGHRSSAGGDRIRRRKRPGKALQGMVSGVVYGYGLLGFARIQGWQQLELGWPELTGMELAAAPEFGPRRKRRCGARASEVKHCAASWSHHELGEMHGRDLFELRPRRRQGRAAVSFWHGGDRWLRHEFDEGSRG